MAQRLSERHKTAFVTGASAGLGLAFTQMLLAEGVQVWGTARNIARLGAFDGQAAFHPVELDLSQPQSAVAAFGKASEAAGGFDLVINNAGYGIFGGFDETPVQTWRGQLDAMVGTVLELTHAAFGAMRQRGRGCLVNVSSLASEFPLPFMGGYNMAKAALSALSESLMFESAGTGVTVIDLRPGDYRTPFNDAMHVTSNLQPPSSLPARQARAWAALDKSLRSAPKPERATRDLHRALLRGRSGIVRTGSFFQATLAPILKRLAPSAWVRASVAKYYGSS